VCVLAAEPSELLAAGLLSVGSATSVAILALMPFMALVPSLQEGFLTTVTASH
jgi:hypothetical protein